MSSIFSVFTTRSHSSRFVIISGFTLILMLLAAAIVIVTRSIRDSRDHLHEIIHEQEKITNVYKMRDSATTRSMILFHMATMDDPFDMDEKYLEFKDQAEIFIKALQDLLDRVDDPRVLEVWEKTRPLVQEGSRIQNLAAEQIMAGQISEAYGVLNEIIPNQTNVKHILAQLIDTQRSIVDHKLAATQEEIQTALLHITILGIAAILLGIAITVYVTQHNIRTEAELHAQRELADKASQAKTTFLANMSHEIRTPLTAIIGFSRMLLGKEMPEDRRDATIQTIVRSGNHLLELINNVLDMSKIEAGQLELEHLDVCIPELISEIKSIVGINAGARKLAFNVNYAFPLPERIRTDPVCVKQILINLCSNAIKFTEEGSINLIVKYDPYTNVMAFMVSDTGIGMDEGEMQRVFEAFTQADASTTRKYGGTGLGLNIARQLALRLGGELVCSSKKGQGSVFTLTIDPGEINDSDLRFAFSSEYDAQSSQDTCRIPADLSGRILLAEDVYENQELIRLYITRTGAQVDVVGNGQEALNALSGQSYDLVLLDIQMPVMDGFEALASLRASGITTPVVMLTANALKSDSDRALAAGANDFVVKPINRSKLYKIMRTYLERKATVVEAPPTEVEDPEFESIRQRFLSSLPGLLDEIEHSRQAGDMQRLEAVAHQLKGLGSSFGFPHITSVAGEINDKLRMHMHDEALILLDELSRVCAQAGTQRV